MLIRQLLLVLFFCVPLNCMQPKSDADMFAGAAGANNIQGIRYWSRKGLKPEIHNSWGRSPLSFAAGNGQYEAVQELFKLGAQIDFLDQNGLTPLAWAVQFSNKTKTLNDYLNVINFLIAHGANVNHSAQGITVLHNAARGGNVEIIQLLLNHGAQASINSEGHQDKGRTPLQEAVRASADAITHVDLENDTIATQAEFPKLLAEAIDQFHKKQNNKLSTNQLIPVINLLKRYGATTDAVDALGRRLNYYIDEVQVISDNDRNQLLRALNFPLTPRLIKYTRADLPQAIQGLQTLREVTANPEVNHKIDMTIWTLQDAYADANPQSVHDKLRIAIALLSKVKEVAKNAIQDETYFADIEIALNDIRTILRDATLTITGKAQVTPVRPRPAPRPTPTVPQPQASQPAPAPQVPRIPTQGILITDVLNYSKENTLHISYSNVGEKQILKETIPAALRLGQPGKITLNRVVNFIDAANPHRSQSFFWDEKRPNVIEDLQKKKELAHDTYAASKIIQTADDTIEIEPDLNVNPTAAQPTHPQATTQPIQPARRPLPQPQPAPQVTISPEIVITTIQNNSRRPVKITSLNKTERGTNFDSFTIDPETKKSVDIHFNDSMRELRVESPVLPFGMGRFLLKPNEHPNDLIWQSGRNITQYNPDNYKQNVLIIDADNTVKLISAEGQLAAAPQAPAKPATRPLPQPQGRPLPVPTIPVVKPAPASAPAVRRPLPQPKQAIPAIPQNSILIREIVNFSNQPATFTETWQGSTNTGPIVINPVNAARKPGIEVINHILNPKYIVHVKSFTTEVLYEIPRDNVDVIEVFENDTTTTAPLNNYKMSRIIVHSNGSVKLMPIKL